MKYHIDVYGCQMNVHDAEIIRGILDREGFAEVPVPGEADVLLLVSCAVREHAETRVLGRAAQLGGLKKTGTAGRKQLIALCGCVAQEHGSELLDRFGELDLVVGPDCYHDLPMLIGRGLRAALVESDGGGYDDVEAVRGEFPRSFVTIMRGCDNYCSYCIVPYVRGRERSRSPEVILEEVRSLAGKGFGEITLLGQNVNSYSDGDTGFSGILGRVADAAGGAWIRFVTSHPRDLSPDVAEMMASRASICSQLHLPVQSGSDSVLRSMNRGYTSAEYIEKIEMLREAVPGIELATDVIAGFPGETEADFQDTVDLLERVRFDYAFLFRYSERTGTGAASMEGQLPVEERLRRLHILQELQGRITAESSAALIGREMKVLVTGPARRSGQQAARSEGNRMVVLDGTAYAAGAFVDVRITGADGWTHFAEPLIAPEEGG